MNDEARLAAVDDYQILDTPGEPGFDDIVQITSAICQTPIALVSIVAGDRQWFKAKAGLDICETKVDSSVCVFALSEPDLLVISDLAQDERTCRNPLVTGASHLRFYAGAPLRRADGRTIGSLCAIDTVPRPQGLTPVQAATLRSLARQVMTQLDLRRALLEREGFLADRAGAEARRNALFRLGDRLRDLTKIGEMTRTAAAIVGETLGVIRAGFGRLVDGDGHLVVEPDWTSEGVASIAGRHRFADYGNLLEELLHGRPLLIEDVLTDPRTRDDPQPLLDLGIRSLVNMPVLERGRTVALFLAHDRVPRVWTPEETTFLRNVADRVEVGVARLKAEADQRVLNEELSHRMKNSFALVQAIAAQTLRSVPDQTPVEVFVQRIHALSTAHDVLLHQRWTSASIGTVVRSVLSAAQNIDRFDVSGPELSLGARATLSLSLLLHELVTNAVKHGALSMEGGRVALGWAVEREGDEDHLLLRWREAGGPKTGSPMRRGFGSRLIKMGLAGTGGVELRYVPSGFEADFRAPVRQLH